MNASDIIKAKQNRVLYQAYYRPKIFPGITDNGSAALITSTIQIYPISSLNTGEIFVSSFASNVNIQYNYTCEKPIMSYELLNDINNGKLICGFPYCSTISEWNTSQIFPVSECDCKINVLTLKNTNQTMIYNVSTVNFSTINIESTTVLTGPIPEVCPKFKYYEGNLFDNKGSIVIDYYV